MVIQQRLQERGHDIITAGRTTGDIRCDIADERQLARLWEQADQVDAVVCAAGEVKYAPLDQLSSSDFLESFTQKGLAQINLVRTGLDHVASRGSFTLTSGIPSRDPVISSAAAATVNGAVEAFGRGIHGKSPATRWSLAYWITACHDVAIRTSSSSTACCRAFGKGWSDNAKPRNAQ